MLAVDLAAAERGGRRKPMLSIASRSLARSPSRSLAHSFSLTRSLADSRTGFLALAHSLTRSCSLAHSLSLTRAL
eukprot:2603742-Pleurochrysis_carterae.AAC.1